MIKFNKPKTAPPKIENKTTTKIFSPNAILKDGTVNKLEHVITVNDATELNVPVHQPIKCACIKSAWLISKIELLNIVNNIVLLITGWIHSIDRIHIVNGIKIKIKKLGTSSKSKYP